MVLPLSAGAARVRPRSGIFGIVPKMCFVLCVLKWLKESVHNEKTKGNHFKLMENNRTQNTPQNRTLSSKDSKVQVTIIRARNKARRRRALLRYFLSAQKVSKAHRDSGKKLM
jgi:hypothetical protein